MSWGVLQYYNKIHSRLTFKPDTTFPSDLPVPEDDGLYNHLTDFKIPADINLPVASDPSKKVKLVELKELTVVFCYPRTGRASLAHLLGPFNDSSSMLWYGPADKEP
jgi:hypothetical protein